jgi:hypothetical protein
MVAHLRANPELAEWVKEKGEPHNRRELLRIWEKYDQMIARNRAIVATSSFASSNSPMRRSRSTATAASGGF